VDKNVKPQVLSSFGDVSLAIGKNFVKYLPTVLQTLTAATTAQVDRVPEIVVELRWSLSLHLLNFRTTTTLSIIWTPCVKVVWRPTLVLFKAWRVRSSFVNLLCRFWSGVNFVCSRWHSVDSASLGPHRSISSFDWRGQSERQPHGCMFRTDWVLV